MNALRRRPDPAGRHTWRRAAWIVGLVLATWAGPVAGKELHWAALDVAATLESDGTLAISELQSVVFTGDWNGGERRFRLFPGQELAVERIVRIDPATGGERELQRGDLDAVDHWDWTSSSVVRWRSRRPEDPPFEDTRIDYRIDYRLTGAFQPLGEGRYGMDHDFAFPDRDSVIEKITVRLTLAPGWRALTPLPDRWEGGPLPPGQGFVVPLEVRYYGSGPGALPVHAAPVRLPEPVRWGSLAVFVAAAAGFAAGLLRRDGALGRFGSPPAPPIDRAWLEANVFSHAPEVVGAAWDRTVGSAEVAALLARLTAEGKLTSEVRSSGRFVRRDDLHLRLLAPRSELNSYERALIDGLFGESDTTDTESLRRRYRSTGFDPASKIRRGVEARVAGLRGFADGSPKPAWWPTALLLLAGLLCLAASFVLQPKARGPVFAVAFGLVVPWALSGLIAALVGQGKVDRLWGPAFGILVSMVFLAFGVFGLGGRAGSSWLVQAGALLLALGLARATFNLFATRESTESLVRRRDLLRARAYFRSELKQSAPQLEDAWFPYLLAFGLAPRLDRWFRRFGGTSTPGFSGSPATSDLGRSSGGSSWTGGGGTFGGGGATATWALAATAMSSGVSAPSSSSSGGGGGGSSGGGGGGGW